MAEPERSGWRERLTGRADAWRARHGQHPVVDVLLRLYREDRDRAGALIGSAIAFRLFLFFVPFLLFVVGVAGFFSGTVDADTISDQAGVSGTLEVQIGTALNQPGGTRWLATLLGFALMVIAGRALSKVLFAASCLAWRMPARERASLRVIGALAGLIVSMALVAVLVNRVRIEWGLAVSGVSFLAAFAWYAVAWFCVCLFLPRATPDPSVLLPGAVIVSLTITGMQAFSELYLPDRFGRASALYGAIGATVVTLGWFFIVGRAIVVSLTLDAVLWDRFGSLSQAMFSLPVLRRLAQRSPRVRRFFGLEVSPEPSGPGAAPAPEAAGER